MTELDHEPPEDEGQQRLPEDEGWQRLDPKMLLLGPLTTVRQMAVPLLIALIGVGSRNILYSVMALPVMVFIVLLVGFVPWLTTRYRVTDTQLQTRRGLLSRRLMTAPLDRVRSVDLEAPLLHRLLKLTKVEVGTGVDDTRIELDSLSVQAADELRGFLLARSGLAGARASTASSTTGATGAADSDPAAEPTEDRAPEPDEPDLARLDWSWLRFAPFSLARLVIVAGALGVLSQFVDDLPILRADRVREGWEWVLDQALPLVIGVTIVACLVGWLVISVGGYVFQWYNLRLFREHGNLRLTAGLFTTRSTSVEEARIRGVALTEPVLLRLVGGAELATLATGVQSGVTAILPPAPVEVARRVGRHVLGSEEPLSVTLAEHGPAARRRCHVRNQWLTLIGTVAALAGVLRLDWSWLVPVLVLVVLTPLGALLGEAEYHHLGHGLTDEHLVAGSGTLTRTRTALERDGIIGWVVNQSWFQRRRDLATLIATTAAGTERVVVRDLPHDRAVELADAATPGMLTEFLVLPDEAVPTTG